MNNEQRKASKVAKSRRKSEGKKRATFRVKQEKRRAYEKMVAESTERVAAQLREKLGLPADDKTPLKTMVAAVNLKLKEAGQKKDVEGEGSADLQGSR